MLSVLIETHNDEEGLARTLASLVGAAVEGVVRDVIVCDRNSTDQTYRVAEHAGCRFLAEGGIGAGIRQAKGEWLLLLEPGARLADGWIEAVLHHTAGGRTAPARFAANDRGGFLARLFARARPLAEGLVIRKGQAIALARPGAGAEALARGLSATRLAAPISTAPPRPVSRAERS